MISAKVIGFIALRLLANVDVFQGCALENDPLPERPFSYALATSPTDPKANHITHDNLCAANRA